MQSDVGCRGAFGGLVSAAITHGRGEAAMKFRPMAVALGALALLATPAPAQDWPAKNITLIVPFAAGGGIDASARVQALALADILQQGVVVENIGAAGGTVGTTRAARAEPDGYTLLIGNSGTHAFAATLYKSLPYDPVKDFEPVGLTTDSPRILLVRKDLPVSNLKEFVLTMNKALNEMIERPDIKKRMGEFGLTILPPGQRTPEYLASFLPKDIERWAR
jgi:tripartite-type tricarboxylate transporter receptor subunit TctC